MTAYDFNSRYEYVQRGDAVVRAVYVELLPTDPHGLTQEGRTFLAQNAEIKTYGFPHLPPHIS
ncbi:hypothetical protein [Haloquadratum walsbyi]|uniref:hypothetical protein n=1 Tax=Haloquadratum walsbyi TaxID=293091 RepID=UPI0011EA6FB3|nr:hypothetical protein [Haloquadratum walsbyi]